METGGRGGGVVDKGDGHGSPRVVKVRRRRTVKMLAGSAHPTWGFSPWGMILGRERIVEINPGDFRARNCVALWGEGVVQNQLASKRTLSMSSAKRVRVFWIW